MREMADNQLVAKARTLAPWHFNYRLTEDTCTADLNSSAASDPNKSNVGTVDPSELKQFFGRYYPNGLAGKTVLDVGCNSGGYCFIAAQLGARRAIGFDIRQHWIDQANFIHSALYPNLSNVEFRLGDAKTLTEEVEITIFKGVFYHLPDPIHVLLSLCSATKETILVDTASSEEVPEHCLFPIQESTSHLMSGVDGLSWFPGGPAAITPVLKYAGFTKIDLIFWHHKVVRDALGRFRVVAQR